jgi:dethiobiotin synthetase
MALRGTRAGAQVNVPVGDRASAAPRGDSRVLVVSGTGTDVGKTVVTAALAALARARGDKVAVVKPVQTGTLPAAPGDLDVVRQLSGVTDLHEAARYPDPLSPEAAARAARAAPPDLRRTAGLVERLAASRQLVLVEGAGGLLVRYDPAGTTIADLAAMLDAPVLVVVNAGLGTLNHTALTLEALRARKLRCAGVVIGSWPDAPGLAERENLADLEAVAGASIAGAPVTGAPVTGAVLTGALSAGAAGLSPAAFLRAARAGLSPALGGRFDAAAFREAHPRP